jgi:hypothetical protein
MHAYRSVTNKRTDINGDDKKSSPIKFPNEKKRPDLHSPAKKCCTKCKRVGLEGLDFDMSSSRLVGCMGI